MANLSNAFISLSRSLWEGQSLKEITEMLAAEGLLTSNSKDLVQAFKDAVNIKAWDLVRIMLDLNITNLPSHSISYIATHKPELLKGRFEYISVLNAHQLSALGSIAELCDYIAAQSDRNINSYLYSKQLAHIWKCEAMVKHYPKFLSSVGLDNWYRLDCKLLVELIIANFKKPVEEQYTLHPKNLKYFYFYLPKELQTGFAAERRYMLNASDIAYYMRYDDYQLLPESLVMSEFRDNLFARYQASDKTRLNKLIDFKLTREEIDVLMRGSNLPGALRPEHNMVFGIAHLLISKFEGAQLDEKFKLLADLGKYVFSCVSIPGQMLLDLKPFLMFIRNKLPSPTDSDVKLCIAAIKSRIKDAWQDSTEPNELQGLKDLAVEFDSPKIVPQLAQISYTETQFSCLNVKPTWPNLDLAIRLNKAEHIVFLMKAVSPEQIDNFIFQAIRVKAFAALKELRPFIVEDKKEKFDALTSLFFTLEESEAA